MHSIFVSARLAPKDFQANKVFLSTDGCNNSSDTDTVATTEVLDSTDVAAVSCDLNVDDDA